MQLESDSDSYSESKEGVVRVGLTVHALPESFDERFKQLQDLTGKVIKIDLP